MVPPNEWVGYLWSRRSGVLLWTVLIAMVASVATRHWFFFGGLVGMGVYLELVHIRQVLQQLVTLWASKQQR